ncbi:uncharacterized protein LOC119389527 [Rhipicephalus sanguineus]|uniref:uncharacterized protein LOC119389527 n=1 Tax=Rhipicephalus sanguineus TaxID=34632 RepID=UPI0018938224|nr:uncharacterized protein LOC119389527 [Rhipicephalus sanguineus]
MAPSLSKEELMRNSDPLVWDFEASSSQSENTQRTCERVWTALNSRLCNVFIIVLSVATGLAILLKLLTDIQFAQDAEIQLMLQNCSLNLSTGGSHSAYLTVAKLEAFVALLSSLTLAVLSLFLAEVLLRAIAGRARFFMQGPEVLDAVVVVVAFGLNVASRVSPDKGRQAGALVILLRVWRIQRVLDSLVDVERTRLNYVLNEQERERTLAQNKGELLILRVEDLEHEVAYLKEKLKKTEKEQGRRQRRQQRDSGSSSSSSGICCRHPVTIGVETCPVIRACKETQTDAPVQLCEVAVGHHIRQAGLEAFASSLSWGLLLDALSARHDRQPERLTLREPPKGPPPELPRQPIRACSTQAVSHGEGSPAAVTHRRASHTVLFSSLDRFSEAEHTESPESGYGSGCRSATSLGSSATGRPLSSRSASVFLFPDADGQPTLEMSTLDEVLEAEPQVPVPLENLNDDDPMTSL